jgi:hypothetical protein
MMHSQKFSVPALAVLTLAGLMAAGTAVAGTTVFPFIFPTPTTSNLRSTAVGVPGTVQTVTLTLNPNGQTITGGKILSLAITGPNMADFAIVPGGTCVAGTTILFPITTTTGQSCTINLRYTPSTAGFESGQIQVTCQASAVTGGFTLTCNAAGATTNLVALFGALAALSPVPALDPWMTTALALLMLAMGTFVAMRRAPRS